MKTILYIAPSNVMMDIGKRIISELGLDDQVDCSMGWLHEGIDIARKAEVSGVDVIVARGGTAEYISRAEIQIPVVEIPISVQDLAEVLLQAKKLTVKETPKIGVVAFRNMIGNIETFAKVMNIHLQLFLINPGDNMEAAVEAAILSGADVIIGGIRTVELAAKRGKHTLLLTSGEDSFRNAFLQAMKVSYARTLEKERMEKFRILVDYSIQGIINIESNGLISVFNSAAERLLGLKNHEVVGRSVYSVLSDLGLPAELNKVKPAFGELININQQKFLVNVVPIDVNGKVSGVMVTVEDIGKIIKQEAAIRSELYSKGLTAQYSFDDIKGVSPEITEVKRVALQYAGTDATVLITGASGTGKELFAQSIHRSSHRSNGPFVAVNCGAITPSLLESELFGYAEGAFTGATKKGKPGYFELAHGGSIFLDEIGEMDKNAQTRLLRVIQERRIMRLGGDKYLPVDVRIIAATNQSLAQLRQEGKFREDLFYRINVLTLDLPAIKDRPGDAIVIAEDFLTIYNQRYDKTIHLSEQAKAFINNYDWPGNVRQLRNYIEKLVVTAKDNYSCEDLKPSLIEPIGKEKVLTGPMGSEVSSEQSRIIRALKETGYNQKEAAKRLGMDRSTLYRKLRAFNIQVKKGIPHMMQ
ncbi:MAG: proprionate catabolism activator, Fis family [Firmicutes bacterium]|nr:proprionate catabolism activator, Fis family [Bacillota bacterium]